MRSGAMLLSSKSSDDLGMSRKSSAELSHHPTRRDWIYRGFTAGALLTIAENSFTSLTGTNIEARYLVWATSFSLFLGLVIGLSLAVLSVVFRRWSGSIAFAFVSMPLSITFVFLSDEAALAAFTRGLPPWAGILVLLLCLGTAFLPGFILLNRWSQTRAPELCITLLAGGTSTFLVAGKFLTRSVFTSYLSPESMILHAIGVLLLAALFRFADKSTRDADKTRDIRPRRTAIHLGGLSMASILLAFASASADEPAEMPPQRTSQELRSPPVILISVDTLRSDHLSLYGYNRKTTPNLERLASDGVLFKNVISPSNWTLPAHGSLFTGTFPRKHAAHIAEEVQRRAETETFTWLTTTLKTPSLPEITRPLPPENQTAAELLRDAGYRTAAIVANSALLHRSFGLDQGFELYDDRERMSLGFEPVVNSILQFFPLVLNEMVKPYRLAEEINTEALRWLAKVADRPFFLFLNYMEPHYPCAPPRGFQNFYRIEKTAHFDHVQTPYVDLHALSPQQRRSLRGLYDGEIAYLDDQIGKLIDRLKRQGLYERSMIIVTSDHGDFFGEHGLWSHGIGPYDQVHRVPLIIKYPRSATTGREEGYVQLIDILPTILKEVGIPIPAGIQGAPLPRVGHPIITEHYEHIHLGERYPAGWGQGYRVLYEAPWKLVLYSDDRVELFNLVTDTNEQRNLSSERKDVVNLLRARLYEYVESMEPIASPSTKKTLIEKETQRKLKSLGYVH